MDLEAAEVQLVGRLADEDQAAGLAPWIDSVGSLSAEELADVVAYAASRARHVNLRQIIVQPTRQV